MWTMKEKEMEMTNGVKLMLQQTRALVAKNFLVSWRNKTSMILQLAFPLLFVVLLVTIQEAYLTTISETTAYENIVDPSILASLPIPPCEDKFFIKQPCFDFIWSGNSSRRVASIINAVRVNNPGRPIPASKVLSFRTKEEVDAWLLKHPSRCPGALHLREITSSIINYGVQTNFTPVLKRGKYEDPTFKFQIPLQIAAEREIARSILQDPKFPWVYGFKEYAHPTKGTMSVLGWLGPAFFLCIATCSVLHQSTLLAAERELKLRQALNMTGLYNSAYWLSWFIWDTFLNLISSLTLVISGMAFQQLFFVKNSFRVLFLLIFLFQMTMISLAYLLSNFLTKMTSVISTILSIFLVAFVTQLIIAYGFPYDMHTSGVTRFIWSMFPPNILAKGVLGLVYATMTLDDSGIKWSERGDCFKYDNYCYITMNDVYLWLIASFAFYLSLAMYLDNIKPNEQGMRKSLIYLLKPGYWTGKGGDVVKDWGIFSCTGSLHRQEQITPDDDDVLQEQNAIQQDAITATVNSNLAVQIRGLEKIYPGRMKVTGFCKRKEISPFHALKGLWMNFRRDQLFCLIGPNGAGKTTVINCLTGITSVTAGDALVYGNSIRSAIGMENIRRKIGVCPQFDTLWDRLTGEEHLHLFASIKGLCPASIKSTSKEILAKVRLSEAAKVQAKCYSGGMRRRLSMAIALCGDPKLVILDEPTTGMDPISRRLAWKIIQETKKGRAIILTTHSMEEADVLSDRIGIMAKGRLRCLGSSIRLKSKFGTGFIATVSFHEVQDGRSRSLGNVVADPAISHEPLKRFFKSNLNEVPAEETDSFLTFVIPRQKEHLLTRFFAKLQDRQEEFGIADIQLSLATLEEVFLNIARRADIESATVEGRKATMTLASGRSIEVPVGARFVGVPGTESPENPTGIMVEICWELDDSGSLCISGQTEMALPGHVHPLQAQKGIANGVVIDPEQVLLPGPRH